MAGGRVATIPGPPLPVAADTDGPVRGSRDARMRGPGRTVGAGMPLFTAVRSFAGEPAIILRRNLTRGSALFKIVGKKVLGPDIKLFDIEAPLIARKIKPGQFIMLRINDTGERIPLTMVDRDPEAGTVTIIFQEVGKTTRQLGTLGPGDAVADFIGPLGRYHPMGGEHRRVLGVGGGGGVGAPLPKTP